MIFFLCHVAICVAFDIEPPPGWGSTQVQTIFQFPPGTDPSIGQNAKYSDDNCKSQDFNRHLASSWVVKDVQKIEGGNTVDSLHTDELYVFLTNRVSTDPDNNEYRVSVVTYDSNTWTTWYCNTHILTFDVDRLEAGRRQYPMAISTNSPSSRYCWSYAIYSSLNANVFEITHTSKVRPVGYANNEWSMETSGHLAYFSVNNYMQFDMSVLDAPTLKFDVRTCPFDGTDSNFLHTQFQSTNLGILIGVHTMTVSSTDDKDLPVSAAQYTVIQAKFYRANIQCFEDLEMTYIFPPNLVKLKAPCASGGEYMCQAPELHYSHRIIAFPGFDLSDRDLIDINTAPYGLNGFITWPSCPVPLTSNNCSCPLRLDGGVTATFGVDDDDKNDPQDYACTGHSFDRNIFFHLDVTNPDSDLLSKMASTLNQIEPPDPFGTRMYLYDDGNVETPFAMPGGVATYVLNNYRSALPTEGDYYGLRYPTGEQTDEINNDTRVCVWSGGKFTNKCNMISPSNISFNNCELMLDTLIKCFDANGNFELQDMTYYSKDLLTTSSTTTTTVPTTATTHTRTTQSLTTVPPITTTTTTTVTRAECLSPDQDPGKSCPAGTQCVYDANSNADMCADCPANFFKNWVGPGRCISCNTTQCLKDGPLKSIELMSCPHPLDSPKGVANHPHVMQQICGELSDDHCQDNETVPEDNFGDTLWSWACFYDSTEPCPLANALTDLQKPFFENQVYYTKTTKDENLVGSDGTKQLWIFASDGFPVNFAPRMRKKCIPAQETTTAPLITLPPQESHAKNPAGKISKLEKDRRYYRDVSVGFAIFAGLLLVVLTVALICCTEYHKREKSLAAQNKGIKLEAVNIKQTRL